MYLGNTKLGISISVQGSGKSGRIQSRKENITKAVHFDSRGRKQNALKEKEVRFMLLAVSVAAGIQ